MGAAAKASRAGLGCDLNLISLYSAALYFWKFPAYFGIRRSAQPPLMMRLVSKSFRRTARWSVVDRFRALPVNSCWARTHDLMTCCNSCSAVALTSLCTSLWALCVRQREAFAAEPASPVGWSTGSCDDQLASGCRWIGESSDLTFHPSADISRSC